MPYLLITLTALFWASNYIAAKLIGPAIPPITLTFLRWLFVLAFVLPFSVTWLIKNHALVKRHAASLAFMGLLSVALFNALLYIGIQNTEVNKASILQSLTPIVILVICGTILKETVRPRQWLGVAVSFAGVFTLISEADPSLIFELHFSSGDLWILCSVLCWAFYSVALRWRPDGIGEFMFFVLISIFGTIGLIPFTAYELSTTSLPTLDADILLIVAYIAIFPSIVGGIFWNYSVKKIGPATAGIFTHAIPLFSFLLSAIILGDLVQHFHIIGLILILFGVACAMPSNPFSRRHAKEPLIKP